MCELRGITWDDPRGYSGLEAASHKYSIEVDSEFCIKWEKQSLYDFTMRPPEELAEKYDLIVIDYPSIGDAAISGKYMPIDLLMDEKTLEEIKAQSLGDSFNSYKYGNHIWALPIDVSAQFSAFRPDILSDPPRSLKGLLELARRTERELSYKVAIPLKPLHAHSTFLSILFNISSETSASDFRKIGNELLPKALEILLDISEFLHPKSYNTDAIEILDEMSESNEIGYIPYVYGYFNYSKIGYRKKLIMFKDIPTTSYIPTGATLGGAGIAISRRAINNVERIVKFLKWLLSKEIQIKVYSKHGGQSYNVNAWLDKNVNLEHSNSYLNTISSVIFSYVRPNKPGYTKIHERSGKVILEFMKNNENINVIARELRDLYI